MGDEKPQSATSPRADATLEKQNMNQPIDPPVNPYPLVAAAAACGYNGPLLFPMNTVNMSAPFLYPGLPALPIQPLAFGPGTNLVGETLVHPYGLSQPPAVYTSAPLEAKPLITNVLLSRPSEEAEDVRLEVDTSKPQPTVKKDSPVLVQSNSLKRKRPLQRAKNVKYKRKDNSFSSEYRGVYWNKNCQAWRARIWYNQSSEHLGNFDSELEAALRYDERAAELKRWDTLNFPIPKHMHT